MKNSFIFTLIAVVAILAPVGADTATLDSKVAVAQNLADDDSQESDALSPFDLFLGMDYDDNYSYTGSESLLHSFPGLIMQELDATWFNCVDDSFFKFRWLVWAALTVLITSRHTGYWKPTGPKMPGRCCFLAVRCLTCLPSR